MTMLVLHVVVWGGGLESSTYTAAATIGRIVKSPETWETRVRKEGAGDTIVLCSSCGFPRGDWVSTVGREDRQPGGNPSANHEACANSACSDDNHSTTVIFPLQTPTTTHKLRMVVKTTQTFVYLAAHNYSFRLLAEEVYVY